MKTALGVLCLAATWGAVPAGAQGLATGRAELSWSELSELPDPIGFGGSFVGESAGALIVAGGANFPGAPPWEGGAKVWHDSIFVLPPGESDWLADDSRRLPAPRAYGSAVATRLGLLCIGGGDGETSSAECLRLVWDTSREELMIASAPSLPRPSQLGGAALVGDRVLALEGQSTSAPRTAGTSLWASEVGEVHFGEWEEVSVFPGEPRVKAVVCSQNGPGNRTQLFVFGGEANREGPDGPLPREILRDAWRFDPSPEPGRDAWRRLEDLPRPIAAGLALPVGQSHVLVLGGDTGEWDDVSLAERPPFPAAVLAYHTLTDTWVRVGEMPTPVVTTGAAEVRDGWVIASGEVRPGVRTRAVQHVALALVTSSLGAWDGVAIALYLVVLVVLGVRFARREHDTGDYFLAGRRIPWWAAGISIYATQLSAITFLAAPAIPYATDWRAAPSKIGILLMAPIVVAFFLPFFRRLDITTAYEYLERRLGLGARLYGAVTFIAFQLVRMAIVVYLPALALTAVTGLDVSVCILAMGMLATVYTVLGGMEAVVWTDVVQTVVLLAGVGIGIVLVLGDVGGVGAVVDAARAEHKLVMFDWRLSITELVTWSSVLGVFLLQLGPYVTDQAVVQRYLSTPDERAAARGIWLNGLLAIPTVLLFFTLGTCLWAFFGQQPELLDVGMQTDEVFPLFVAARLPDGLAGLVIAGVFAASMSSLDSSMHAVATSVTTDIWHRFRPAVSDKRGLFRARLVTVLAGAFGTGTALVLATWDVRSLFFFFESSLGLLTSGIAGVFLLAVFAPRVGQAAALTGAAASLATMLWVTGTGIHFYLYPLFGVGACVAVALLASLVLPPHGRDLSGLTWVGLRRAPGRTS